MIYGEKMVRGYQRRVVFLRNTGSRMFEEAYFLLREDEGGESYTSQDMISEANRIIDENLSEERENNGFLRKAFNIIKRHALSFLIGSVCGGISVIPLFI